MGRVMSVLLAPALSLTARAGVLTLVAGAAVALPAPSEERAEPPAAAPAAGAPAAAAIGAPAVATGERRTTPGRTTVVPVPARGLRSTARGMRSARLPAPDHAMVAAMWSGEYPHPEVRTRARAGGWGPWVELPELVDGASDLAWMGDADGVQVRTEASRPRDLELVLIDPGELPTDQPAVARRAASTDTTATAAASTGTAATATAATEPAAATVPTLALASASAPAHAPMPKLHHRWEWGADNSLRNGKPVYLDMLKQVHLHHTATGNGYSRSDVPRIIRGMYRYHTQTLGWFDIGYNFLVDRFGRAWVGRSGGPHNLVRGAHTLGFNHVSVGISVIGTNRARKKAVTKVVRVAAWKFDSHGRDAKRLVRVRSHGSDKFPEGKKVQLPAIDGHRDTNHTACPGDRLYRSLGEIRHRAQRRIDAFG